MQNHNAKTQIFSILNFKLWFYALGFALLVLSLYGCSASLDVGELLWPSGTPTDDDIVAVYDQIELKASTSADVLSVINIPEEELLSQSKSVVASIGQKKKGFKMWLKMAAFNEDDLTVRRKYVLIEDEKPKQLFVEPWAKLKFDCQMALEEEILNEPFANDNAKQIAILEYVQKTTSEDIDLIYLDNKMVKVSGMLINQAIETVLVKLASSPAGATRLKEPKGFEFNHISYDKGKIRMTLEEDIVSVRIWLGSALKRKVSFEKPDQFEPNEPEGDAETQK